MKKAFVYVIRCQGTPPNWYIGQTKDLEARMCEHWAGEGSLWTKKWLPTSVVEVTECPAGDPLPLERAKTVEYCCRYGWAKVRGAGHVRVDANIPAWFDESGDRRKRGVKGKDEAQPMEKPPEDIPFYSATLKRKCSAEDMYKLLDEQETAWKEASPPTTPTETKNDESSTW
jgi:predicted GIY-YIG superfamily endonuclease